MYHIKNYPRRLRYPNTDSLQPSRSQESLVGYDTNFIRPTSFPPSLILADTIFSFIHMSLPIFSYFEQEICNIFWDFENKNILLQLIIALTLSSLW
jgi:hypothetical protein